MRAFARPIALTFHHEPEDQRDTHGTEADFVTAWKHIHDVFLARGATNVIWALLTRDPARYRTYFPKLSVIAPDRA